ncbi:MAG: phage tail assembly protein [Oscillospiraceae bacterium]|nr:phage tail assembly protein [Oscillospiraceae bacterium]
MDTNDKITEGMTPEMLAAETVVAAGNELLLKLKKPYVFDGVTYTAIDLSGLENVTAGTLENVGKILAKRSPGLNPATLEMEMSFCNLLAARVTNQKLEFFERLPARDAVALKSMIVGFLYGGDGDN